MRFGFIGNMNNYPYTLALALYEAGHDLRFIIDSEDPLCRPAGRFVSKSLPSAKLVDLAPMRTWDAVFKTRKHRAALATLRSCDAVVANNWGIAMAPLAEKPYFVISTGSDLDMLANPAYLQKIEREGRGGLRKRLRAAAKRALYNRLVPMQRRGFREAAGVEYAFPGVLPHGDALLHEIGVPSDRRYCFMLTDLDALPKRDPPSNRVLTVLCVSRLNWREPLPVGFSVLDNKRTDILLRGTKIYCDAGGEIELRLFRKGLHIAETEELIDQLGLGDKVVWLNEMPQTEFTEQVAAADVVADHFGQGTIGIGGRDALAIGRPLVAGGDIAVFAKFTGEELPIVHASTPEEVAGSLERLTSPAVRADYAARGRHFAESHFSSRNAVARLLSALIPGASP